MFLDLAALDFDVVGEELRPRYLCSRDVVWVEALMDEYDRCLGKPRRILDERLSGPFPAHVPHRRAKAVRIVLDAAYQARLISPVSPQVLRSTVFEMAGALPRRMPHGQWRRSILLAVGADFGLTLPEVERCLFADVPSEKIVTGPEESISPQEVLGRANLLVAQSLLFRSRQVLIEAEAGMEVLVRTARLLGLICSLSLSSPFSGTEPIHPFRRGTRLEISGPLSILGRTTKYGRALARLLPVLAWAPRWSLQARVELSGRPLWYRASHRDGLLSGTDRPKRFDSKLEERFQRDFAKLAPEWDILREPEPVFLDGTFLFPDFGLVWNTAPEKKVLVELVGFWTPAYLERKVARLRRAGLKNCIVCVDESLALSKDALPGLGGILFFRRRIDAAAVLAEARRLVASNAAPPSHSDPK